jgi:hypothetical protein
MKCKKKEDGCYECNDDKTACAACLKGYKYHGFSYTCERMSPSKACPSDHKHYYFWDNITKSCQECDHDNHCLVCDYTASNCT